MKPLRRELPLHWGRLAAKARPLKPAPKTACLKAAARMYLPGIWAGMDYDGDTTAGQMRQSNPAQAGGIGTFIGPNLPSLVEPRGRLAEQFAPLTPQHQCQRQQSAQQKCHRQRPCSAIKRLPDTPS